MSANEPSDVPRTEESDDSRSVRESSEHPLLVACGASAGGLQAFSELLAALPADVPAAFVLVQHLAPDHDSMLSTLLQRQTKLHVEEACNDTVLERGHVY